MDQTDERPAADATGPSRFVQLAGEQLEDKEQRVGPQDVIVTRHGRRIGRVRPRAAGQYEALNAREESLGWFNSAFAGARALLAEPR